jgi:heme/copper-type cytochrome/quinol oxidase subunit 2
MKKLFSIATLLFLCTLLTNTSMLACPVCYGNTESPMIDGMNTAILAMLGITGFVLTGISTFFIMMRKKIKSQQTNAPFIDKKGELQWNNF